MLNAYRGIPSDRPPVAPEFWYYYPAKILKLDMIEFTKEIPFHIALKKTFEKYDCEGWGIISFNVPNGNITTTNKEIWRDKNTLQTQTTINTPEGQIQCASIITRQEPAWATERFIKDRHRDIKAWEYYAMGGEPEKIDTTPIIHAWNEVGTSYLLEAWLGVPFFDFYACARDGGFETAIYDFFDPDFEHVLERLREQYIDYLLRIIKQLSSKTPLESFCLGCSWSCNSLIGPSMWRKWDKPLIKIIADEIHKQNKLLHIHFHGKCMETIEDFAEIGIDCVCPFERPPGGDVNGVKDLKKVAITLKNKTTMNGNVHTVETLIRGTPEKTRQETLEILDTFRGNPRVIVGTGDQVGRETKEENLKAMIETVKSYR